MLARKFTRIIRFQENRSAKADGMARSANLRSKAESRSPSNERAACLVGIHSQSLQRHRMCGCEAYLPIGIIRALVLQKTRPFLSYRSISGLPSLILNSPWTRLRGIRTPSKVPIRAMSAAIGLWLGIAGSLFFRGEPHPEHSAEHGWEREQAEIDEQFPHHQQNKTARIVQHFHDLLGCRISLRREFVDDLAT